MNPSLRLWLLILCTTTIVGAQPTITLQPTNTAVYSAGNAIFTVTATGNTPLRYQWFFNDQLLKGRTARTLTIANVQLTNDGRYFVVVSNVFGPVTSKVARLGFLVPTNGQIIKLGDDPLLLPSFQRAQAEPHIARSFVDPNLVLATFQEGRFTDGAALDCGYAVSHDAGITWSRGLIPGLTTIDGGGFDRATDPVAAIDHLGNMYLCTLAITPGVQDAFSISRSTNGGLSFGPPVIPFTNDTSTNVFLDKQWLAVNSFPGTPTAGRLVLAYTHYPATNNIDTGGWLGVIRSDDQGRSWTKPQFVGPPVVFCAQPAFLPDGSLVIAYLNYNPDQFEILLSPDGGSTFESPRIISGVHFYKDPVARGGREMLSLATDRMSGALFMVWQGRLGGNNGSASIFFTRSIDRGHTWSEPKVINDTPGGAGVFNAGISASPDGQHLIVLFYDKRNDTGKGYLVDAYIAESFDGGSTWEPNERLSDVSSDLRKAPLTDSGYMLGDYQAVVPALDFDTPAIACWIDTRSGDPDPYIRRIDRRRGTTFQAWRQLRFSSAELADDTVSGAQADPDRDGIRNLAEYAHGLEPRHADAPPVTFRLRRDLPVPPGEGDSKFTAISPMFKLLPVAQDVEFLWQESSDLMEWVPASPFWQQTNALPYPAMRQIEAAFMLYRHGSRFLRVDVTVGDSPLR